MQLIRSGLCWLMLALLCLASYAQEQEDYYRPKKRQKNITWLGNNDLVRSTKHWYLGLEGGGRWHATTLSNDLSGFLNYQPKFTNEYWSAYLGYHHSKKWSVEVGYGQMPTRTLLSVNTARQRALVPLTNHSPYLPLRFKYRVWRIGKIQKQSGLDIGAGVLWFPNRRKTTLDEFNALLGYRRIAQTSPARFDTLVLRYEAMMTGQAKFQLEGSIEFVGRVARSWELVFYARTHYAFANPLQINASLIINDAINQTAMLTINPHSYQFGMAIRWLYGLKSQYHSKYEE